MAETPAARDDADMSPLDFMLSVMRDPNATRAERIEMAKAAAPYFHGRAGAGGSKARGEPDTSPLMRLIERRVVEPDIPSDPADGQGV